MNTSLISPDLLKISNEIHKWAIDYLSTENKDIKRPKGSQVVCPFVKPSIESNAFYLSFHAEDGRNEEAIERIMLSYLESFRTVPPYGNNDLTKSILVVFNNISNSHTNVLDIVHNRIKDKFVENGLMIGQFHKNCKDTGIYNANFKVSISPYPLIAIRNMAIHDILFLKNKREWFVIYNNWFGDKFKNKELDEHNNHLEAYYQEAKKKFSL